MSNPGPRQNSWAAPRYGDPLFSGNGAGLVPVLAILRTLWWSTQFHTNPATGLPGTIRQRAVPSAGACYPVQIHVLCGESCDVPPGAYAFDADRGHLVPRSHAASSTMADKVGAVAGAIVVFTVLPQRTAAKYHHRALPLLLADAAYAMVALAHLAAGQGIEAEVLSEGPESLASTLGLPDYSNWHDRWPDTAPELALTATSLGVPRAPLPRLEHFPTATGMAPLRCAQRGPRCLDQITRWLAGNVLPMAPVRFRALSGVTATQLASRRSSPLGHSHQSERQLLVVPLLDHALATFHLEQPPNCRVSLLDRAALQEPSLAKQCAGQYWTRNLEGMLLFQSAALPDPARMWWASSLAAHVLFTALGSDAPLQFRPVGGWTGTQQDWITLHGLGFVVATS